MVLDQNLFYLIFLFQIKLGELSLSKMISKVLS